MAHIKCRYTHYRCTMHKKNCYECGNREDDFFDNGCYYLECDEGYFEGDSKSVDFDGQYLIVGKKFFAQDTGFKGHPEAEDNEIDFLEIDGREYINYEKQQEEQSNATDDMERQSEEQGWELVRSVW